MHVRDLATSVGVQWKCPEAAAPHRTPGANIMHAHLTGCEHASTTVNLQDGSVQK